MKPTFNMTRKSPKSFVRGLAAVLLTVLQVSAPAVHGQVPAPGVTGDAVVQTSRGITYVSGGVGAESIDRLNGLARDFNLKLVFALQSGSYVSDVKVAIADAAGKALLDATSDGPWFLAKLPAGTYQVAATFGGNVVKRQVSVGAARLTTADFRWASE
jgi:hypothetical protein